MKRGMTVKRMLAGLLGAAMLFTAVGVAEPVEVKAATHNIDAEFEIKESDLGTFPGYPRQRIIRELDYRNGDTINYNITLKNNTNKTLHSHARLYTEQQSYNFPESSWTIAPNNSQTQQIKVTITSENANAHAGFDLSTKTGYYTGATVTVNRPGTSSTPGTTTGTGTTTGSTTGTGTSTDTKPATEKTEPAIPVHTHSYNWETLHEPTEEHDGEMADICSVCGDIRQRVPITGFYLFQKETMDKIRAAAPNATVEVKTSKWISFHRMVMNALAERQDVTLKVSFLEGEYRGARKTLTIPAGTDTNALLNEDGYAGFKYLGGLFGLE